MYLIKCIGVRYLVVFVAHSMARLPTTGFWYSICLTKIATARSSPNAGWIYEDYFKSADGSFANILDDQ